MQDESSHLAKFFSTYDRFKLSLGLNDEQAAERIGVSRQTIWKIQKRRQKLTKRLIFRLEQAEIKSGIIPSDSPKTLLRESSNPYTCRDLTTGNSSIKKVKILALRDDAMALKGALALLTKAIEGIQKQIWELEE